MRIRDIVSPEAGQMPRYRWVNRPIIPLDIEHGPIVQFGGVRRAMLNVLPAEFRRGSRPGTRPLRSVTLTHQACLKDGLLTRAKLCTTPPAQFTGQEWPPANNL